MPLTWTFSILHCLITFFAIPTCKSSSFLLCNCVQSLLYFTRPSTEKKLFYRDWTLWTVSKINHKLIKYLYCSVWNDSRLHLGWQIEIFFSFSTVSDLRFTILVGVSLVFSPPLTMLLICALIFSTILIGCKRTSGTFINLIPIFCFRNLQIIFISRTSFNKAYLSSKRIRSIDDKDAVTDIFNHDLSLLAKLL